MDVRAGRKQANKGTRLNCHVAEWRGTMRMAIVSNNTGHPTLAFRKLVAPGPMTSPDGGTRSHVIPSYQGQWHKNSAIQKTGDNLSCGFVGLVPAIHPRNRFSALLFSISRSRPPLVCASLFN